jgi:hypothetical protein
VAHCWQDMFTFEKVKIIFRRNKLLDARNSTTHKNKKRKIPG